MKIPSRIIAMLVCLSLFFSVPAAAEDKDLLYQCYAASDFNSYSRPEKALPILEKLAQKYPNEYCVLRELGIAYHKQQNYQKAVEYLEKALKIKEDSPALNDYLGLSYQSLGQNDKAKTYFSKACELGLDISCSDAGKTNVNPPEEKEQPSFDLSKDKPESADFYYHQGKNFQNNKQYNLALESFRKAVEKDPKHKEALNELGFELEMSGKYEEAITYYKKAIDVDAKFAKVWTNMGYALKSWGKIKESHDAFSKACELGDSGGCGQKDALVTGDPTLKANLISDLIEKGSYEEATKKLNDELETKPSFKTYYLLGTVLMKQNKNYPAMLHFKRALELNPSYDDAYKKLALVYKSLNKKKESKETLDVLCQLISESDCTQFKKELGL
jgi:tetratricopeptide (TPR) repeat protein